MSDIKVAVFDVDGTLLNHVSRRIEDDDIKCLQALRAQGIKIVVASGRPPYFVKEQLPKYVSFDYYICLNGTYIMDQDFHELYSCPFTKEETTALISDFSHYKQFLQFQFPEKGYMYTGRLSLINRLMIMLGRWGHFSDHRKVQSRHEDSLPLAAVSRIKPVVFKQLEKKYPNLQFDRFFGDGFDIHPKQTSKGNAIAKVCERLDCSMEQVIAFGDNLNDLSMIEACGIGVAMGNAIQEVKDKADYVTAPCGQNGIYKACKTYGILE